MLLMVLCGIFFASNIVIFVLMNIKTKNLSDEKVNISAKLQALQENYTNVYNQVEGKNQHLMHISGEKAALEASLSFAKTIESERNLYRTEKESLQKQLVQMQEKLSSQTKLEADLKLLLENAKLEITNQNRVQYKAIYDQLVEKNKEFGKENTDNFTKILEKDVVQIMQQMSENLSHQQKKLENFQAPVESLVKIFSGSKESGTHGEQSIVNQLDAMGLKYGIDYLTQVAGKGGNDERLIADVVILVPNSGKKDVLIIDSKSSTKLGGSTAEFMSSIKASATTFAGKDYKNAVERRLKEEFKDISINQTHSFIYLPFDRMLSRISEEEPDLLRKIREKEIGILTPVILDFLLDSIKLYASKLEMQNNVEAIMLDVKTLIERTGKVLEFIKDLGKSIDQTAKKYTSLKGSVSRMFVPIVNKMAKPLNVKAVTFDDTNDDDLKEIEIKTVD
jgi:DNA anti-recombination protein RmuC